MKVSELAAQSGVALATIKYYLRESLLMPGEPTSATGARYGEQHVERLALIRALAGAGLAIPRIRAVLELVESDERSEFETFGRAIAQLPPYVDPVPDQQFPRARKVLEFLDQVYEPRYVAVAHLERALIGLEDAGLSLSDERLRAYGDHIRGIAEVEIELMPTSTTKEGVRHAASAEDGIRYAVLGTAMYEPVLTALRRLAHQDLAARHFPQHRDSTEQENR